MPIIISLHRPVDNKEPLTEDEEKVLSYTVVLGSTRKTYPLLVEFYGSEVEPTLKTVIQHLYLIEVAFIGLAMEFLDFIPKKPKHTHPGNMDKIIVTDFDGACKVLEQVVSLLHIPKSFTHPLDNEVVNLSHGGVQDHVVYRHLDSRTSQMVNTDFTYLTNTVQSGDIPDSNKTAVKFHPVIKATLDDLLKKAISLTTTASPSTICLFGNMSPSPSAFEEDPARRQLTMNYFSQPHFNSRARVDAQRVQMMLDTCAGMVPHLDLVSHGVTVVPYIHKICTKYIPHDFGDSFVNSDKTDGVDLNGVSSYNEVQACFLNPDAKERLCGIPIAEPIAVADTDMYHLYTVLLGLNWDGIIGAESEEIRQIFELNPGDAALSKEEISGKVRLRDTLLAWLLIQTVDREYQGFRNIEQWMKLHWRLTQSHLPVARGLPEPRTVHSLIYQCIILIQATSNFRLAIIGGQGRHFGAIHSLLGIDPTKTTLPLLETSKDKVPPFKLEILGSSNPKVDIVDLSIDGDYYNKEKAEKLQKLSDDIQLRDESLIKIQVSGFLERWCTHCEDNNIHEKIKALELSVKTRTSDLYKASKFNNHEKIVPLMAIEFMAKEIVAERNDTKFIRNELATLVTPASQAKRKPDPSLKGVLTLEQKAKWLENILKTQYKSGYISRFQNIVAKQLAALIFIMSHGFYSLPERRVTATLLFFLQDAGAGKIEWDEEIYKFPDPEAIMLVSESTTLFTEASNTSNSFIRQRNIKVRRV
jgi:hypothetical protein